MPGSHFQCSRSRVVDALVLTKTESAELLLLINAYATAVVSSLVDDGNTGRRVYSVDKAARALERLLDYVEQIS